MSYVVNDRIKLYRLDEKPEYFDLKLSGELCRELIIRENEKYDNYDGITVLIEKYGNAIELYGIIQKSIVEELCRQKLCICDWNN